VKNSINKCSYSEYCASVCKQWLLCAQVRFAAQ